MLLDTHTRKLQGACDLDPADIPQIVHELLDENVNTTAKENFFVALTEKGETPEELAAFAQAMRAYAVDPQISAADLGGVLVDTCGTGGDKMNVFNVSTAAALVVASAGVPVAKHGNRAVTSKCGSADVLEALGIRIDLPPADAKRSLVENRFAFFFAPLYHPAFKALAPLRKALAARGQRTVFNLLGPLLNPARPNAQVVGIFAEHMLETYAKALKLLGAHHALVVHGEGMDELTTVGGNLLCELRPDGETKTRSVDAGLLGLNAAKIEDLVGGSAEENAAILENIFRGEDRGPRHEIVLLNAAAAFVVADRARNFSEGIKLAAQQLDSGAVVALLDTLRTR